MIDESILQYRWVKMDRVRIHTVQAGSDDAPLVILLHGFPEFWCGWKNQIAPLVEAGFRVWVPDQRGYGDSTKPRGVSAYAIDELVGDVLGVMDAARCERAHIVGHDWGGAVAWQLAATHPQRVERLVIMNCPHPRVMARNITRNPAQMLRSAYIFFFQIPMLPELVLRAKRYALLQRALRGTSRRGTFSKGKLALYRQAWSQPGALTGMINWYRAIRLGGASAAGRSIKPPTLLLWGARDQFLGRELAEQSLARCENGRLEWVEDATHWLHHEEPERVSNSLLAFLREDTSSK